MNMDCNIDDDDDDDEDNLLICNNEPLTVQKWACLYCQQR